MEKYKESMEYVVYKKIKDAIINKLLTPGTQLVEQTLSEKLNVSRTPIRNAFKKLESEGFVENIPYRGTFIIQPTKEEIIQAFKMRMELESLAVQFGLEHITKDHIERLSEIVKEEEASLKERDLMRYFELNKTFHIYIALQSKNKFLIEFLDQILDQIHVYLILYDRIEIDNIEYIKSHETMIALIDKNQKDELERYIRLHLQNSLNDMDLDHFINKSIAHIFD